MYKQNSRMDNESKSKVFCGGLDQSTTNDSLTEYFSNYGELTDVVVMRDSMSKKSRGFGFVTFQSMEEVDQVQLNRPHTIDGKTIETKRVVPKTEAGNPEAHTRVPKMFVGGLNKDAEYTEEDFRNIFTYGEIKQLDIIKDKETGRNRGFAFITFTDHDPVDRYYLIKKFDLNGATLDVRKALSKQEKEKAQESLDRKMAMRGGREGGRGGRGGRGGGRGGRGDYGGGYSDNYSGGGGGGYGGGYSNGGGYNQGYNQGGYNQGGGSWNQGGGSYQGGGGDGGYNSGGYNQSYNQGDGNWQGGNYSNQGYSGGPMKSSYGGGGGYGGGGYGR